MFNKAKCKEMHSSKHSFVFTVYFIVVVLEGLGEGCDRGKMVDELEKTTRAEIS